MAAEYLSDPKLDQFTAQLLKRYFRQLSEYNIVVKAKLKSKINEEGEYTVSQNAKVKLVKIPDLYREEMDAHYLLVVDAFFWYDKSLIKIREATFSFALDHIAIEHTDTGEIKVRKRQPDIVEFSSNVSRFGFYDNRMKSVFDKINEAAGQASKVVLPGAGLPEAENSTEEGEEDAQPEADEGDEEPETLSLTPEEMTQIRRRGAQPAESEEAPPAQEEEDTGGQEALPAEDEESEEPPPVAPASPAQLRAPNLKAATPPARTGYRVTPPEV